MASRRRITLAATTAAAILGVTALAGCGAIEKAFDCATVATEVAGNVQNLQEALNTAGDSPQAAADALNQIEQNLNDLGDQTGDADVSKAVDDLSKGVTGAQAALDKGEVPDITPISTATTELTKVCTPG